jgi:hypothetical protein
LESVLFSGHVNGEVQYSHNVTSFEDGGVESTDDTQELLRSLIKREVIEVDCFNIFLPDSNWLELNFPEVVGIESLFSGNNIGVVGKGSSLFSSCFNGVSLDQCLPFSVDIVNI